MSEREKAFAIRLANTVLDLPNRDPDGDTAVLARQFLRALEPKWQPIETAPKDGTDILVCDVHAPVPCAQEVHWRGTEWVCWPSDLWAHCPKKFQSFVPTMVSPTHWQPIPGPPQ